MSLPTPPTVQKLQEALHAKAKAEPGFRFYSLYDKLSRRDVLFYAYLCREANDGAAGVDGQTFQDIKEYGVGRWLDELANELRTKTYRPAAVRRVFIPKPDGKPRPLGIPTIKGRVAQMAALVVLGPIFEADLQAEQYAYRKEWSALDALARVQALLGSGHREVVDADLSGYFDSIPHGPLMKSVSRRISDGNVLALVKGWLEAPVEETDERGQKHRTTRNKDAHRGTPQGGVLSPLLANLSRRRFVPGWKVLGHERRLDAPIVNYADDFVICCRSGADEAMAAMRVMMSKLGLTVNEAKTRRCRVPDDEFDFLGYTFGRNCALRSGPSSIGPRPSAKKVRAFLAEISEQTGRARVWLEVEEVVGRLNRRLRGWAAYFSQGRVSAAYRQVPAHTCWRLRQWLGKKHRVPRTGRSRYSDCYLRAELGLVWLSALRFPRRLWAKA